MVLFLAIVNPTRDMHDCWSLTALFACLLCRHDLSA
jgi:hypothetical protein